jgi:hypothetical protein
VVAVEQVASIAVAGASQLAKQRVLGHEPEHCQEDKSVEKMNYIAVADDTRNLVSRMCGRHEVARLTLISEESFRESSVA